MSQGAVRPAAPYRRSRPGIPCASGCGRARRKIRRRRQTCAGDRRCAVPWPAWVHAGGRARERAWPCVRRRCPVPAARPRPRPACRPRTYRRRGRGRRPGSLFRCPDARPPLAGIAGCQARGREARRRARVSRWSRSRCRRSHACWWRVRRARRRGWGRGASREEVRCRDQQARSRTCIRTGWRVRRLTCGSISIVCPSTSVRSKRRASIATCVCISIMARCSPIQARGPSPNGR